jgi:hypothetical protein
MGVRLRVKNAMLKNISRTSRYVLKSRTVVARRFTSSAGRLGQSAPLHREFGPAAHSTGKVLTSPQSGSSMPGERHQRNGIRCL